MRPAGSDLKSAIHRAFYEERAIPGEAEIPRICQLHQLSSDTDHNCLACNFAEAIERLDDVAGTYD